MDDWGGAPMHNYTCPACQAFWSTDFTSTTCPRCGYLLVDLSKLPKSPQMSTA